jgi:type IV pilus assembly protein PilQ
VKHWIGLLFICFAFPSIAQWDPFVNNGVFITQEVEAITLQCEEVALSTVLQTLAEKLQINLLLTEPLNQPVSMTLKNMSTEAILQSLLQAYGLRSVQEGKLQVILPAKAQAEKRGVQTFRLKYADAEQLADTLKSRIQVGFDARTNALIVYEPEEQTRWLRGLLAEIDVPAKQVYIEAMIMNASASFSKELGLRFQVDEFSIATLPKDIPLKVAIAAAQENHQTQVLANPKLLTVNLQEAQIKQGKQIAYQETSASGATSVTFQEAALELKVRPMITPEHDIVLTLMVKQDVLGTTAINGQPTIDTKAIQAKVRVKDGETVVLGGIYSESDHAQARAVPWLGKIPLIGLLFQEHRQFDEKDELLIFVTPRVVL